MGAGSAVYHCRKRPGRSHRLFVPQWAQSECDGGDGMPGTHRQKDMGASGEYHFRGAGVLFPHVSGRTYPRRCGGRLRLRAGAGAGAVPDFPKERGKAVDHHGGLCLCGRCIAGGGAVCGAVPLGRGCGCGKSGLGGKKQLYHAGLCAGRFGGSAHGAALCKV